MKVTQADMILRYLRTHKRGITAIEALDKFGCMRLSGRIWDLRHAGYCIETDTVAVKNRYGDTCYIARYKLVE